MNRHLLLMKWRQSFLRWNLYAEKISILVILFRYYDRKSIVTLFKLLGYTIDRMCPAFPLDWPVMFPSDPFVLSASFVSLVLLAFLVFVQNMVFFLLILLFFWFSYLALKHLKIS